MRCVHDAHPFAGTTAEIYLYRFMPYRSTIRPTPEDYAVANKNLYDLCRLFEERNEVELVVVDGLIGVVTEHPLNVLIETPNDPFTHRVQIGIKGTMATDDKGYKP